MPLQAEGGRAHRYSKALPLHLLGCHLRGGPFSCPFWGPKRVRSGHKCLCGKGLRGFLGFSRHKSCHFKTLRRFRALLEGHRPVRLATPAIPKRSITRPQPRSSSLGCELPLSSNVLYCTQEPQARNFFSAFPHSDRRGCRGRRGWGRQRSVQSCSQPSLKPKGRASRFGGAGGRRRGEAL